MATLDARPPQYDPKNLPATVRELCEWARRITEQTDFRLQSMERRLNEIERRLDNGSL